MFLDQRRRAIELGRQRALLANSEAVAERHRTAFQRLLQNEQRRRAKEDDASNVPEYEKTTSLIGSQGELDPSLSLQLPSAEIVEAPVVNVDLTPTAQFTGEQTTDINEDLSALSVDAPCKPNQTTDEHIDLTEDNSSQPVADSIPVMHENRVQVALVAIVWSDRPKLRQINADLPLERSPEPTLPVVTNRIDTDVQTVSSHSDKQPSDLQPASTAATNVSIPHLLSFRHPRLSTWNMGHFRKLRIQVSQRRVSEKTEVHVITEPNQFFIASEEPDPQRMQRKCDQLEARRATEQAFVAQQLQARRTRDRENKQSVEQAQHERRAVEREKRDNLLQVYRGIKEPDSRLANPYPVQPGTVALSCSEVNLSTSPKERRKISQCSNSSKRIPRQPNGTDVRSSIKRFRPNFRRKPPPSCTQPAVGLRGSGDEEAVKANECEEDEDSVFKSNETVHEADQLPNGLSLSSLHRLGATESPSESAVRIVLQDLHENLGHAGQNKLEESARRRFWWPHRRRDVEDVCSSCGLCAQIKNPKRQQCAPLQSMLTGYPNEIVEVDIVLRLADITTDTKLT
ncbi:uncharacterized protein DEA37_0000572 [Paragonimus westermani]|uniref:Integrase zinc-binding domain-containing protein n=1 Tax=Paragonimus westermani TaxID=34504 RepID=A0A5J4P1W9_9TREM|nr:uncharacterized protein DEA37_0000572 [Paragonimus westermani]